MYKFEAEIANLLEEAAVLRAQASCILHTYIHEEAGDVLPPTHTELLRKIYI